MMGSNACYCCGKSSHMMMDCLNKRGQEKGRRKFSVIVKVKRLQGGIDSSHSMSRVHGKALLVMCLVRSLN